MKSVFAAVVFLVACNKDNGGKEVVAKFQDFAKQMCACKDKACADKVNTEMETYSKSDAIKKPSDEQMSSVVKAEGEARDCARPFDDLDKLKANMESARKKAATGDTTAVAFDCSMAAYDQFVKKNAELAKQPDVAKLLEEYRAYCSVGVFVEMATKDVEAAEAEKAAKPDARPTHCTSTAITMGELQVSKDPDAANQLAPLKERLAKVCP